MAREGGMGAGGAEGMRKRSSGELEGGLATVVVSIHDD